MLPVTRLFVQRCVWPYPLLAVFSRWYVSPGFPMPYHNIPHGHTLCISPIESVCTGVGAVWSVCALGLRRVCVCVRCVGSGVRVSGYVASFFVHAVGGHGPSKRLKIKPCKCAAFGWVGGRRSSFCPCPLPAFGVCPVCLCFASRWYLQILEVWRGVVLPVTRLFVQRCVWPYPLLAVLSQW